MHEYGFRIRAQIPGCINDISVDFAHDIIDWQDHKRQILVDHTDQDRCLGIHNVQRADTEKSQDCIQNAGIGQDHLQRHDAQQEIDPHGQHKQHDDGTALIFTHIAQDISQRIGDHQADQRTAKSDQDRLPQCFGMDIIGVVKLVDIIGESMDKLVDNKMINKIEKLLQEARTHVAVEVNNTLLRTYMEIGKLLVEDINLHENEENYQNKTISMLSKELTRKFGKGFSRANIWNMITFYKEYGSVQTVSERLSWSHYCELLSISDKAKRHFYEIECANSRWSVRELRRQIASSLFERLLLSDGKANKQKVLELSLKGNEIVKPQDIVKDPYVFEFLGIPENKPMMESDLEEALVRQIEKFLLELGKGFMFVGTQQRVTFGNVHYYVDMVFYNKILKSYVLIELKTIKLMPEAVGQLNMYLNYYAAEVNDEDDNPPIGLILCTDKGNVDMQYALGGLSNNIFASKYVTYMPDKEQLIAQVEAVLSLKDKEKK